MRPEFSRRMRHKSHKTTLGYINLATQIEDAASGSMVPDALKEPGKNAPPPFPSQSAGDGETAA